MEVKRGYHEPRNTLRHGALSAHQRVRIKACLRIAAGLLAGVQSARKNEDKDAPGLQAAMLCTLLCQMMID